MAWQAKGAVERWQRVLTPAMFAVAMFVGNACDESGAARRPLSVDEIAEKTGIHRRTVFQIERVLDDAGLFRIERIPGEQPTINIDLAAARPDGRLVLWPAQRAGRPADPQLELPLSGSAEIHSVSESKIHSASESKIHSPILESSKEDSSKIPSLRSGARPERRARDDDNPRGQLWREGSAALRRLTGMPEGGARRLLGQLLRDASDDCAAVLGALAEALDMRPVDPVAWLTRAVRKRGEKRSSLSQIIEDWDLPSLAEMDAAAAASMAEMVAASGGRLGMPDAPRVSR
ncbi:MAG TPA: hypothetical protein VNE67_17265 [Acetobacteraceae bacterium]|nr:hypothetical protein [Stellaceae bacterium]HVB69601.1 hypothetical protein [Acetobacteraceae bacterium]